MSVVLELLYDEGFKLGACSFETSGFVGPSQRHRVQIRFERPSGSIIFARGAQCTTQQDALISAIEEARKLRAAS